MSRRRSPAIARFMVEATALLEKLETPASAPPPRPRKWSSSPKESLDLEMGSVTAEAAAINTRIQAAQKAAQVRGQIDRANANFLQAQAMARPCRRWSPGCRSGGPGHQGGHGRGARPFTLR